MPITINISEMNRSEMPKETPMIIETLEVPFPD
jgi:hypothetical protein